MKSIKFKTNINCAECVKTVSAHLDKLQGIESWRVNTNDKDRILEVTTGTVNAEEIIKAIEKAGYYAEQIGQGKFYRLFK